MKSQIFLHIEIVPIRYEWGEVKNVPGNKILLRYILEQCAWSWNIQSRNNRLWRCRKRTNKNDNAYSESILLYRVYKRRAWGEDFKRAFSSKSIPNESRRSDWWSLFLKNNSYYADYILFLGIPHLAWVDFKIKVKRIAHSIVHFDQWKKLISKM